MSPFIVYSVKGFFYAKSHPSKTIDESKRNLQLRMRFVLFLSKRRLPYGTIVGAPLVPENRRGLILICYKIYPAGTETKLLMNSKMFWTGMMPNIKSCTTRSSGF